MTEWESEEQIRRKELRRGSKKLGLDRRSLVYEDSRDDMRFMGNGQILQGHSGITREMKMRSKIKQTL